MNRLQQPPRAELRIRLQIDRIRIRNCKKSDLNYTIPDISLSRTQLFHDYKLLRKEKKLQVTHPDHFGIKHSKK